ncbi:hypothetical protein [Mangrovicoccus ximenensis]|uniref:hypothetical protein n=1 Tax=Mangrovicoccus ximenensis TaxID=1911570 RepID=UPI00191C2908|nr:hypothetical protein [Mangrovicoccus ximenensis]
MRLLSLPFRLLRGTSRLLLAVLLAASLALNVATVTSTAVFTAVSGAVSAPMRWSTLRWKTCATACALR